MALMLGPPPSVSPKKIDLGTPIFLRADMALILGFRGRFEAHQPLDDDV
jgi:hypothetical protein